MTPPRLVLATRNPAKLAEVRAILAGWDVAGLDLWPDLPLPPEDAAAYDENALGKARAVARATGRPALGDDSGLEVAALGGRPGVLSSRYAGEAGDAAANNRKLLAELAAVPAPGRQATFVCVAALAAPDGREWLERGVVDGVILAAPRGGGGFGYDPLFAPAGDGRTFAEMPPAEKNAISHRARAFGAVARFFGELG